MFPVSRRLGKTKLEKLCGVSRVLACQIGGDGQHRRVFVNAGFVNKGFEHR
jgi:hypothetical protein